jgi:hypothetical protein
MTRSLPVEAASKLYAGHHTSSFCTGLQPGFWIKKHVQNSPLTLPRNGTSQPQQHPTTQRSARLDALSRHIWCDSTLRGKKKFSCNPVPNSGDLESTHAQPPASNTSAVAPRLVSEIPESATKDGERTFLAHAIPEKHCRALCFNGIIII